MNGNMGTAVKRESQISIEMENLAKEIATLADVVLTLETKLAPIIGMHFDNIKSGVGDPSLEQSLCPLASDLHGHTHNLSTHIEAIRVLLGRIEL